MTLYLEKRDVTFIKQKCLICQDKAFLLVDNYISFNKRLDNQP
jgi:hypothetical protein